MGLRITWGSVSGAISYKIYTSNSKYGSYSYKGTSSYTTYDDISVNLNSPGSGYYYQITAVNSSGVEGSKSAAKGVTLPNGALVCFYTPSRILVSTVPGPTPGSVRYYNYRYYTGYYVTIGSIEYYDTYNRGSSARTSLDEVITPGTYAMRTKYRYQIVQRTATTGAETVTSSGTSSYVDRPSLMLKIGYHYQIDATTGEVTSTPALTMD
jgi:hypothetical protein